MKDAPAGSALTKALFPTMTSALGEWRNTYLTFVTLMFVMLMFTMLMLMLR